MKAPVLVLGLLLIGLLAGCTSLQALHTELPAGSLNCTAVDGKVPPVCAKQVVEVADTYRLYFAEFDDQGRPYPEAPEFGQAYRQIPTFLKGVEESVSESPAGVSVVVFVHGWLHSSSTEDSNLAAFRRLLSQLAKVENYAFCKRNVIGLYVGWRGAGTIFADHPADTLTFWSRKFAAEQVATGSFQQVLAGLKAMQSITPDRRDLARGPAEPNCSSRLKTTYVGHSFGGLILMASMSQDLIRGLMLDRIDVQTKHAESLRNRIQPDELIVAINPAIEGARFDALFRVASATKYGKYQSPRFIAITSRNDWATGSLFPIGRTLNTLTKRYPEGDRLGRDAARIAVGHDKQYLTRTLVDSSDYRGPKAIDPHECDQWSSAQPYEERARVDVERMKAFYESVNGAYDANAQGTLWPRVFCASHLANTPADTGLLVMDDFEDSGFDRNVPIWNILTQKPIIKNHGDIENVRLVEFLRQIYVDTMFFR